MEKKYSAYLCSGCGIGDALDMEALAEVVTGEMSMDCKTADCLCGSEGRALIENDIAEGINTIKGDDVKRWWKDPVPRSGKNLYLTAWHPPGGI